MFGFTGPMAKLKKCDQLKLDRNSNNTSKHFHFTSHDPGFL